MSHSIIVIDDDREMCEEIREVLVDEGYSVRMAFDGLEGLELIQRHACDVLLLDLKMPGLDGTAILRRLKHKRVRPKILVLTARLLEAELPEKLALSDDIVDLIDGVLTKPFDVKRLLAAIEQATEGMRTPSDTSNTS
jgi:CheY-like chemotaxis protein